MDTPQPWDQQPGESDAAYARFLLYRNLGPARSIDAAYAVAAPNRAKANQRASGQWKADSAQFGWAERAAAWDVAVLTETGRETVIAFVHALRLISQKTLQVLLRDTIAPCSWDTALEAVILLGSFIPAETVQRLQADADEHRTPAIGAGSRGDTDA